MGELNDKAKGIGSEFAGKMKQQSSDPKARTETRAQDTKEEMQNLRGEAKGAVGDVLSHRGLSSSARRFI